MTFHGTAVIITGGGNGIDRAFAEQGANVLIVGRTTSRLAETAHGLPNIRCCLHGDLTTATPDPALVAIAERQLVVLDDRITALAKVRDHLASALSPLGREPAHRHRGPDGADHPG